MPSLGKFGSVLLVNTIFFNFINVFSLFRNYLPLEKGVAIYLNKLELTSTKNALPSLVEIGLSGSEEEDFNFFQCIFVIS